MCVLYNTSFTWFCVYLQLLGIKVGLGKSSSLLLQKKSLGTRLPCSTCRGVVGCWGVALGGSASSHWGMGWHA